MGVFGNMYDSYDMMATDEMTVRVSCPSRYIYVTAAMPSKLAFTIKSKWDNFLGNLQDNMFFNVVDTALQVTKGLSLNNPFLSRKVWKGTDPLVMQLNLKLVSYDDAYFDVWHKSLELLSMAVPRQIGSGLAGLAWEIPGPKPLDISKIAKFFGVKLKKAPHKAAPISVRIGRLLYLEDLFITDVKFEFDTALEDGYPLSADIALTVSTQESANMGMLESATGLISLASIPNLIGA